MCNQPPPPPWPFPCNPQIVAQEEAAAEAQEIRNGLEADVPHCLNTGLTVACANGPELLSDAGYVTSEVGLEARLVRKNDE